MNVIKRDGRIDNFDRNKITNAVLKAFIDVDGEESQKAKDKSREIAHYISNLQNDKLSVEEIQDIVEEKLMASNRKDVARSYIIYRNERNKIREKNTDLMKAVKRKLKALQIENQNANVDEKSFGGRIGSASSEMLKKLALEECVSEMSRNNHLNNEIYIHDLDSYYVGSHNCLTMPFDDLLANGFNTRQTDVRPANSINTAFQLVAVLFQLQSLQQFGGVSASHLDWSMIPYVRKSLFKHYLLEYLKTCDDFYDLDMLSMSIDELDDWVNKNKQVYLKEFNLEEKDFFIGSNKLNEKFYKIALFETKRELQQAVEGLFHNLNTLQSRSGNQLPFTSLNFGTCTKPEGRLVTKALLEGCIKGVGKLHKTSVFPCIIFQSAKGINQKEGEPNYDLFQLSLKASSQRLYPNYANIDWSGNKGYDVNDPKTYFATMGKCKLQLI